jgi:hypothetical protein
VNAVPLYELVLRFPSHEETRLSDRPVRVGDVVKVGSREWLVHSDGGKGAQGGMRVLCVPANPGEPAERP